MKLLLILIILSSYSLMAQNQKTIVAVGEAKTEKELFHYSYTMDKALSVKMSSVAKEVAELFKNDFLFYRHKYEVRSRDEKDKVVMTLDGGGYDLRVHFSTAGELLDIKGTLKKDNKVILTKNTQVTLKEPRSKSHKLANDFYQAMNDGANSIFSSKIIFISDKDSKGKGANVTKDLYIMDFDGRRVQRLTFRNSIVLSPDISPDNTKILYSVIEEKWKKSRTGRNIKTKNVNLYMYDLIKRKTVLLSSRAGINSGAIFAADSKSIYLTLSFRGNADIYNMNFDTKKIKKVTSHYSDDVDPSVNRSGDRLVFLSGRAGKAMIYTMDPRGIEKDVKRISFVGKFNAAPRFSPLGDEIVFSAWVDGNGFDLYRIDSQGQNLSRLTKNFGSNEEANYSPDGEFIVFTSQKVISRTKADQNIYIMNREGEILGQISKGIGNNFSPKWSK